MKKTNNFLNNQKYIYYQDNNKRMKKYIKNRFGIIYMMSYYTIIFTTLFIISMMLVGIMKEDPIPIDSVYIFLLMGIPTFPVIYFYHKRYSYKVLKITPRGKKLYIYKGY